MVKTFKDFKNELKEKDPSLVFSLEIMAKIMIERNRQGVTQSKLSEMSGVAQKTISRLENGLDMPTLETIGKLAYALGLEIIAVNKD
jgi:transcriptional regulator with XRE-family HTH domain